MQYKLNEKAFAQVAPQMDNYGGKDQVVPMFVPMKQDIRTGGATHDGKPVVPVTMGTRKHHLEGWVKDGRGEGGGSYSYYAYQYIALIATFIALPINIYLAGALAFLTGFLRSEYLYCIAWNIDWYKGKSYIAVK
jgi:hypothetical protein